MKYGVIGEMADFDKLWRWKEVYERYTKEATEIMRRKMVSEQCFSEEIWDTVYKFTGDSSKNSINGHWFLETDRVVCKYIAVYPEKDKKYRRQWKSVIIDFVKDEIYYEN